MPLKSLLPKALDLVLPRLCAACRAAAAEPGHFCADCAAALPTVPATACPGCGGPLDTAVARCRECLEHERRWQQAYTLCRYRGLARDLVQRFKYNGDVALAPCFARQAAERLRADDRDWADWLLLPVPLHWFKQLRRGYNQSELFARELARRLDLPIGHDLRRRQYTKSQTRLDFSQRQRNLRKAFAVKERNRLEGRKILLVDDVFTTGATLDACANVVLKAGAGEVAVLTIARG